MQQLIKEISVLPRYLSEMKIDRNDSGVKSRNRRKINKTGERNIFFYSYLPSACTMILIKHQINSDKLKDICTYRTPDNVLLSVYSSPAAHPHQVTDRAPLPHGCGLCYMTTTKYGKPQKVKQLWAKMRARLSGEYRQTKIFLVIFQFYFSSSKEF